MRHVASLLLVACRGVPAPAGAHTGGIHDGDARGHGGGGQGGAGPLGHRFERADEWVARFEAPDRDAWQKPARTVELCGAGAGMIVADLGAGTGYFEPHLSRAVGAGGRVLALDAEHDMVRYLGERAAREGLTNIEARLVPFDDPRLPPRGVDRVLIVDTWHHIADRPAYTRKLAAGLRAGGAVCVVDFTREAKHGPPPHLRLPPEQVAAELAEGGLRADILAEDLPEQYMVVGRLP